MGCLSLYMDTILVVENAVTDVLGFCYELVLTTDAALLRE